MAISAVSSLDKCKTGLEGIYVSPTTPPYSTDTLTSSTSTATPTLGCDRPKLSPPDPLNADCLCEFIYMKLMNQMKKIGDAISQAMIKRINLVSKKAQEIAYIDMERIKKNAEKVQDNQWWSILKKAATALLSALSLGLGLAIIGGGGSIFAGGALIVSGILSLTNFACSQAEVWDELAKKLAKDDEAKQNRIKLIIQAGIGIVSAGLGIFGGIYTIGFTANYLVRNVLSFLEMALSSFQAVTTLGQGIAESNLIHSQAELIDSRDKLNIERLVLQLDTQWLQSFMEASKDIGAKLGQAAQQIIQSNLSIVQA